jgi:trimeric autotransporter adhesin
LLFGLPSSLVSGGIIYNNASSGALDFRTNNNQTQLRIDKNGKVGIGTITPSAKLEVIGKAKADSAFVHTLNVNKDDPNSTRILEVSSVFGSDQVIIGKNGTAVHEVIRAVINRDMGPILSQNTQYEVFNIPNVDFQSTVTVSPNFNLPDGLIIENARVTAVGQVTVKFYNATSGIVNPVVGDFVFIVIR